MRTPTQSANPVGAPERCPAPPGAGRQGAFGGVAPNVGFAYLSNLMGGYGDASARALIEACRCSAGI